MNRVTVVGDAIIDVFRYYTSTRKSPEADCPVLEEVRHEVKEGGALNVARNINSLTQKPCYFFTNHIPYRKTRIIHDDKQICRIDETRSSFHELPMLNEHLQEFNQYLNDSDVLVLSDYGQGALDDPQFYIKFARVVGIPVLVDPDRRKHDWSIYSGVQLIKCNEQEYEAAKNKEGFDVIITKGAQGCEARINGTIINVDAVPTKEVDVTGCGDTFMAVLALLWGKTNLTSMLYDCNKAASIVCGKPMTEVVTSEEMGW